MSNLPTSEDAMTDGEHEYFHKLIFLLETLAEPKFERGTIEHRAQGSIWDLSDEQLEREELNEIIDLLMYRLTRLLKRRENSNGDGRHSA